MHRPGGRREAESNRDHQVRKAEKVEEDGEPLSARRVEAARHRERGKSDDDISDSGGESPERGHLAGHHQRQKNRTHEPPQVHAQKILLITEQSAITLRDDRQGKANPS
jgi:hypothetical protein